MIGITIDDIKIGSRVMVLPAFGTEPAEEVKVVGVYRNIKNGRPGIDYLDKHRINRWAYLSQVTQILPETPLPFIWGYDEEVFPTLGKVKEAIAASVVDHLENCECGEVVHGKRSFNIKITVELIDEEGATYEPTK